MNKIDVSNDDFGAVLNFAVRYACGRRTYSPSLVIGVITPMLPNLTSRTLQCFDQDLTEAKWSGGYGDHCDNVEWLEFHKKVREERESRGETLYRSWRHSE